MSTSGNSIASSAARELRLERRRERRCQTLKPTVTCRPGKEVVIDIQSDEGSENSPAPTETGQVGECSNPTDSPQPARPEPNKKRSKMRRFRRWATRNITKLLAEDKIKTERMKELEKEIDEVKRHVVLHLGPASTL